MGEYRRLARFTREVSAEGLLDKMLAQLPPEEIAGALAGVAQDRGYAVGIEDIRILLSGLDVRQA